MTVQQVQGNNFSSLINKVQQNEMINKDFVLRGAKTKDGEITLYFSKKPNLKQRMVGFFKYGSTSSGMQKLRDAYNLQKNQGTLPDFLKGKLSNSMGENNAITSEAFIAPKTNHEKAMAIKEANRETANRFSQVGTMGEDHVGTQFGLVRIGTEYSGRLSEMNPKTMNTIREDIKKEIAGSKTEIDSDQAIEIVQKHLRNFMDKEVLKQSMSDQVDKMDIGTPLKNELKSYIRNEKIKDPEMLKAMTTLLPKVDTLINKLKDGSTTEKWNTILDCNQHVNQLLKSYMETTGKTINFDDLMLDALQISISSRQIPDETQSLYDEMISEETQDMLTAFQTLWMDGDQYELSDNGQASGGTLFQFGALLTNFLGDKLGVTEPPQGSEKSFDKIPKELTNLAKDLTVQQQTFLEKIGVLI